jgi:phenylacetate-CoA ligase
MALGAAARRWVFMGLDALRGGRVRAHLRDLEEAEASPGTVPERHEERLQAILRHAAGTTPFYRDCDPGAGLAGFPIIDRQMIKAHYDDLRSRDYPADRLMPRQTSGSSGEPLTMLLSAEKRARQVAEYIHFSGRAGFRLGMRHAHLRAGSKPRLVCLRQNQVHLDSRRLTVDVFERWRRIARRGLVQVWVGAPTPLQMLAAYCASRGDRPSDFRRIRGIITIGEALMPVPRERIARVFGVVPLGRYASVELGVVAHERRGAARYEVNSSGYHVEVLDREEDRPVGPGEPGRLVITDLFGGGMPLIRYDIGDIGVLSDEVDASGVPMLERIEGRAGDVLTDLRGGLVSSFSISYFMRVWDDVARYQFVQEGPGRYRILIVPGEGFGSGDAIRRGLEELLGAPVAVEEVGTIPTLPSGKHASVRVLGRETRIRG